MATKTPGKPVVLSSIFKYANSYIPTASNFPKPLSKLFDASTLDLIFDELLAKFENVYDSFTITRDEGKEVDANTQKQAKCGVWFHQKAGKVTASNFKSAVCADSMHIMYIQHSSCLNLSLW